MALITCPECGAQVSSNAKQCVHCGCKYSVCPECGGVFAGDVKICPACGYSIDGKTKSNKTGVTGGGNSVIATDVFEAWESRSATDKTVMKTVKWTYAILYILAVIFILIAYFVIDMWDTDALEAILNAKDISIKARGLIITGCTVCGLAPIVKRFGFIYSQVLCGAWLRKNGIDVTPYLKQASGQVEISAFPKEWDFENLSSAAYIAAVPNDKSIKLTQFALCSLTAVIAAVCCGIFLTQNADMWLRIKLTGEEFVFQYAALIPAVIFIGLYYVAAFVGTKIFNKRKTAWLESIGL